jgi:transposase
MNTKLTEEQIKYVKTSYYGGVKPSYLAEELGVHASTIYRHLEGVKVKYKKVTLAEVKEIHNLANNGMSLRKLAELYGISKETVRRIKRGL